MPVIRMNIIPIWPPWGRSLPEIPIELRRYGRFLAYADRLSYIAIPAFGEVDPADQPAVYLGDGLDGAQARSLLRALLHELLILLLSLDQQGPLGRNVAAWLFNVDVLARLQGGDRQRGVQVVGSGDGDGVYVLLLEDLAKVLVAGGSIA